MTMLCSSSLAQRLARAEHARGGGEPLSSSMTKFVVPAEIQLGIRPDVGSETLPHENIALRRNSPAAASLGGKSTYDETSTPAARRRFFGNLSMMRDVAVSRAPRALATMSINLGARPVVKSGGLRLKKAGAVPNAIVI